MRNRRNNQRRQSSQSLSNAGQRQAKRQAELEQHYTDALVAVWLLNAPIAFPKVPSPGKDTRHPYEEPLQSNLSLDFLQNRSLLYRRKLKFVHLSHASHSDQRETEVGADPPEGTRPNVWIKFLDLLEATS